MNRTVRKFAALIFGVTLIQSLTLFAATRYWTGQGADDDWETPENWTEMPTSSDTVNIGYPTYPNAFARLTTTQEVSSLYVGNQSLGDTLIIDGGDLRVSGVVYAGTGSSSLVPAIGTIIQSNGTFVSDAESIYLGNYKGTGVYEIVSGTFGFINQIRLGENNGFGYFRQYGGDVNLGTLRMCMNLGGYGSYELYGGNLNVSGTEWIPNSGTSRADFYQSGGTNITGTLNLAAGVSTTFGTYLLEGGKLVTTNDTSIGRNGTGIFTQTGGEVLQENRIYIGRLDGAVGEYHFQGGTMAFESRNEKARAIYIGYSAGAKGTLVLGDENGTGIIDRRFPSGITFHLSIRSNAGAEGTLRGWGNYPDFNELMNSGRVVADGYGNERDLVLSGRILDPVAPNTADNGWFAINGGRLELTPVTVASNSTRWWGASIASAAAYPTMINSMRLELTGAAGTINGALLDPDRSDVPTGLYKPLAVWDFDDAPYSAVATIRYDNYSPEATNIDPSNLRVYQHNGSTWVARHSVVDPVNHLITAELAQPLGKFAVSMISGSLLIVR